MLTTTRPYSDGVIERGFTVERKPSDGKTFQWCSVGPLYDDLLSTHLHDSKGAIAVVDIQSLFCFTYRLTSIIH